MFRRTTTPTLVAAATCSLAFFSLAACTARDSDAEAGREADSTATAAVAPATPNVVTVTARDFAFDAPAEIPSGMTTFHLVNNGPDVHHIQLVKLEQGKTMDELISSLKPEKPMPDWAVQMGGPNTPRPGGGISDGTLKLEPGNYAMICLIPAPDGVPHFVKGMTKALTVTAATTPSAPEPVANIVVKLVDYDFEFSQPLTPGRHTIRFENPGPQAHEMFIAKLSPGTTAGQFLDWISNPKGPPPAEPIGGITSIERGGVNFFTGDFPAGDYGLYCFEPDEKSGKPHLAHGMMKQIKVGE